MFENRKLSIYITGAHCAGKTTLQETLMNNQEFSKYKFYGQKEIAREWIKARGYTQVRHQYSPKGAEKVVKLQHKTNSLCRRG